MIITESVARADGMHIRQPMAADPLTTLTERQRECLRLIARGFEAKEIAIELDITLSAVTERLREARRRLRVATSREAAALLAREEGTSTTNRLVHMPFVVERDGQNPRLPLTSVDQDQPAGVAIEEDQAPYRTAKAKRNWRGWLSLRPRTGEQRDADWIETLFKITILFLLFGVAGKEVIGFLIRLSHTP